jgi:hypothetical protein
MLLFYNESNFKISLFNKLNYSCPHFFIYRKVVIFKNSNINIDGLKYKNIITLDLPIFNDDKINYSISFQYERLDPPSTIFFKVGY